MRPTPRSSLPSARPATYTRLRWDAGRNLTQPDRAEYFWAAIGGPGPANPETRVNYNELSLYAEMGGGRFSFYINTPYRNQEGDVNGGSGGFGDLTLGTKTHAHRQRIACRSRSRSAPRSRSASPARGSASGTSAWSRRCSGRSSSIPETYWQGQLGYWIPISGTPGFAGSVLFCNNTLNHVICRPMRDTALIGTIETSGLDVHLGFGHRRQRRRQFGERHDLLQRRPRSAAGDLRQARLRLRRAVRRHQQALRPATVPHGDPLAVLIAPRPRDGVRGGRLFDFV